MGFDIGCVVNTDSLRGEYLCPVCHTLVYPNEALQTQCTHIYCRLCLSSVVRTTNVCPYDGYLVKEEDSKPLVESDKALAERLDKTLVCCLFYKSGCSWQGPLSQCKSHCYSCSFGHCPVVCNRCGILIAHREVQEHAQTCVVPNPQAQTNSHFVAQASQAPESQAIIVPPSSRNGNPHVQANTSAAWTTSGQWYPQYYQQYTAYDPYQQYCPYQQQTAQHFLQHAPQVGEHPQVYAQHLTAIQPHHQLKQQVQCQSQANSQPQITTMTEKNIQEHLKKLAKAKKKEKQQLNQHIIDLQKKNDEIQLLESEIEKLSGALKIFKTYSEEENLKDKDECIEQLESLNRALLIKERSSNDELQNARKEFINLLQGGLPLDATIGVKMMGQLDYETIFSAATKKYPDAKAREKADEFYQQFVAKITNPNWSPFKIIVAGAEHKQVLDEEDDYVRTVKKEWDDEVYNAVVTAIAEMNEYNSSGGYTVCELWNFREGRKATLAECVKSMGNLWSILYNSS